MRSKSGSTHSPRLGLHVGLTLTLAGSLAAQGAGVWLALTRPMPVAVRVLALGLIAVSLAGVVGALLMGGALLRARGRRAPGAAEPAGREQAAALAQAQKMEALGLLAGGVAHDFNNLLHVIHNSLEILQRQGPQPDSRRHLEMIRRSADRGTALTRQLLAFSRRQPLELQPLDPNDHVTQVAELLRHSLGEGITIETVLGRGVGSVAADAGQLETALLNLAINARDAMPHAGLLTIETANSVLDESSAAARNTCSTDPYVVIAVSDNGMGMSAEVAARACEPFFTTKEPGQGTGLGLSQVAGFAQQSGGHVRISSEPGKGTTVRLYLPRSGHLELEPPAAQWPAWPIKEATRGAPVAAAADSER